nr:glycerophosphoryl diester phosphodiesterase membrane domain-containing protein [Agromyces seonyuensis]
MLFFAGLFFGGVVLGGPAGVVIAVILGLALGLGAVVLAFWLQTKLVAVPTIIVLERAGLGAAIARSWRLTRGRFWPIFGVLLLIQAIVQTAAQVVTLPISLLGPLLGGVIDPTYSGAYLGVSIGVSVLTLVITMLVSGLASVVTSSIGAIVTIDQRMRSEGLDLELQRVVEARAAGRATGDPFAAPGSPESFDPAPSATAW